MVGRPVVSNGCQLMCIEARHIHYHPEAIRLHEPHITLLHKQAKYSTILNVDNSSELNLIQVHVYA